jgi:hypothetical protein
MAQLGRSELWGTLTGLYHWGDVDICRGYQNAGTPDSSHGTADAATWGAQARLDWDFASGDSDSRPTWV